MVLYKYIPNQYLDIFLKEGVVLFRSLSFFQNIEGDKARGDTYDGVLKHSKSDGIEINNLTSGLSEKIDASFESSVESDDIFVFCTSLKLCENLASEFKSDVCVEIFRPEKIISSLRAAIAIRKSVKPNKLFHGKVSYYDEEEIPGTMWASPSRIAMRKLNQFETQEEYRFMFSVSNALEFGKAKQIVRLSPSENHSKRSSYPEKILKVGSIKKWCKVHKFT